MKLIICLICSIWFFATFNNQVKKHAAAFYIITVLISAFTVFIPHKFLPPLLVMFINKIFVGGVLQGAIFIIVMYVSVLPQKTRLRIKLSKVRGEMAIIAALFTLIHNISYGKRYFMLLFTDISALKPYEAAAALLSVCMIMLLVPLTVTSFNIIRKKMSGKSWKKLQRLSYIFYALLYFHIVLIFSRGLLTGRLTYLIDLYIYTLIFGIYAALRLIKYFKKKAGNVTSKRENGAESFNTADYIKGKTILSTVLFSVVMLAICVYSTYTYSSADVNNTVEAKADGQIQDKIDAKTGSNRKETSEADNGGTGSANKADTTQNEQGKNVQEQQNSVAGGEGFKDGEFEGSAVGYNGKLTVSVVVEGGKIKDIKVVKHIDDEEYFYPARDKIIQSILEKQSTDVDAVSGATTSSDAIIKAIKRALGEKK